MRKKRGPRKGRGSVLNNLRLAQETDDRETTASSRASPHAIARDDVPASASLAVSVTSGPAQELQGPVTSEQQPLPLTTADDEYTAAGMLSYDDSFLSFDDFAHNVLADTSWLPYLGMPEDRGQRDQIPATPYVSPGPASGEVSYETPQTAFATTIALPNIWEPLEITPIVERCVQLWFEHQYPTYPLLSQAVVSAWLQNPNGLSKSEQTLLWSICAMALVVVDDWPDLGVEQRAVSARQQIRKCQQRRIEWEFSEAPTFEDILCSLFIAIAYFELKCRKTSWFFVRQAITLAYSAGLHDDQVLASLGEGDQVRRRRAYALLYITERGAAMFDGPPVSILTPPPLLDAILPDESPSIAAGLRALQSLFALLDLKFVKIWNDATGVAAGSTLYTDLVSLQTHLRDLRIQDADLSDIQMADVLITQQWLRLVFWQAALKLGFVSTAAADPAFTYTYPAEIAIALCNVVKSLPPVAIQVHGLGIFEKQFEVAYSLMDTLALSGTAQPEHHECLRYLLLSLSASPASRQIYVRTLERKMGSQQKYRSLAGVELLRDSSGGSRQQSRRQSLAPGTARRKNVG